jgi:hypothetical protein
VRGKRTSTLAFRGLTLVARMRAVLAGAGPVARTTPLLGAVVLLAALAATRHGSPSW